MMNWKGLGRILSWIKDILFQQLRIRDLGKPRKTSVRKAGIPVDIRTEYLSNTNQRVTTRPACSVIGHFIEVSCYWIMKKKKIKLSP
jgi:hypothetical protein